MLAYMFKRRKSEIEILSIIAIYSIAVYGVIAIINNVAAIVGVIMRRTRKEFYKCNVIVTLLYLGISYMIMIDAVLGFAVINF